MTKQTNFPAPPEGHIALLSYDAENKRWQAVHVDATGSLKVYTATTALPTGAAKESKQLPDGHNVTIDNVTLGVTGTFFQETQPVSIASELPAGTKNIGDVDVATMPTVTVQAAGGDKIFAFESIVEEGLDNNNLSEGSSTLSGTPVPAGKVQKITSATMSYTGTPPDTIYFEANGLAENLVLFWKNNPESEFWYPWVGEVYLQAGDYMRGGVVGATATDDLVFRFAGVQMDAP